MPHIVLLSKPHIDWPTFLTLAKVVTGRSVTRGLDMMGKRVGDDASYIISLSEMHCEGSNPIEAQREAGALLRHLAYSFIVVTNKDTILELALDSDLHILNIEDKVAIISGNLEQWRTTIINCCTSRATKEIRLLFDNVLIQFEKLGLSQLWAYYSKKKQSDNTFTLEYKK